MKNKPTHKPLTSKQYIRQRARMLPIAECWINDIWDESKMANIIVARQHTNGHLTVGVYLVDLLARGTKDTFYRFNIPRDEYESMLANFTPGESSRVDYPLVHNIIYGANEFAKEHGFKVCDEFALTSYILEEDTEEIEYLEISFGVDGKPFLFG